MQVLEDLYLGDIHPSERSFKKGCQYVKALNNVVKVGGCFYRISHGEAERAI